MTEVPKFIPRTDAEAQLLTDRATFGGSERYGRWLKELKPVEKMKPIYREWQESVLAAARGAEVVRFLDAGCGNGTIALPLAESFAQRTRAVHAYLLDIQKEGIDEVGKWLQSNPTPRNAHVEPMVGDMTRLPATLEDNALHGILCTWVLHWLPEEKMQQAMQEFERTLAQDGKLLIAAPSIFNQLGIRRNDDERLAKVLRETDDGQSIHPYHHPGAESIYSRSSYLFTEPAMRHLLQSAGFTITQLEWSKLKPTSPLSNGQPAAYKESLFVLAQKP